MSRCFLCRQDRDLYTKTVQWRSYNVKITKKACVHCALDESPFVRICERCDDEYLDYKSTGLCYFCRGGVAQQELWRVRAQNARTSVLGLQSDLTLKEWMAILIKYKMKCFYCKTKDFNSMDHIRPVSKGGGTTKDNVIPACSECNSQKYTTY